MDWIEYDFFDRLVRLVIVPSFYKKPAKQKGARIQILSLAHIAIYRLKTGSKCSVNWQSRLFEVIRELLDDPEAEHIRHMEDLVVRNPDILLDYTNSSDKALGATGIRSVINTG